jgi:hypothetical protein
MSVATLKFETAETIADKMRRLRTEARVHARDHAEMFARALAELEALAADIAEGGEAYPVGVRETARVLAPELNDARLQVVSIMERAA